VVENFHESDFDFGGEKFHRFAESQFITPTNMAYESENEIRTHKLQNYVMKSII